MPQTAFNKFEVTESPTSPGDITTGSLATTLGTFGASTITWSKVGKLYFNIKFQNGGGIDAFFGSGGGGSSGDAVIALTQAASLMGLTINTSYIITNYGAYTASYPASTWTANVPTNNTRFLGVAFLAN